MTDDILDQIKRDANKEAFSNYDSLEDIRIEQAVSDYECGATKYYEVGHADGYNLAIDVVKQLYVDCLDNGKSFMEELEKIRNQ